MVFVGNTDCHGPYVRDLETTKKEFERYIGDFEDESETAYAKDKRITNNKVFIVHGHDGELKEKVARRLEQQGIEAIILSEQANRGKTIIEKLIKLKFWSSFFRLDLSFIKILRLYPSSDATFPRRRLAGVG